MKGILNHVGKGFSNTHRHLWILPKCFNTDSLNHKDTQHLSYLPFAHIPTHLVRGYGVILK